MRLFPVIGSLAAASIEEVVYCSGSSSRGSEPIQESPSQLGHYKLAPPAAVTGDSIGDYLLSSELGSGSFAVTFAGLSCSEEGRVCAIKVCRREEYSKSTAEFEEGVLKEIMLARESSLSLGKHSIVEFMGSIQERPDCHCLVFEQLGPSLLSLLLQNDMCGMYLDDIREIARASLEGLEFLHEAGFIHGDIKIENICLVSKEMFQTRPPKRFDYHSGRQVYHRPELDTRAGFTVKLIDLGNSVRVDGNLAYPVCTIDYRPPEVLLLQPYGPGIDTWSLACALAELYLGDEALFYVLEKSESAFLAAINTTIGPIPQEMLDDLPTEQFAETAPQPSESLESKFERDPRFCKFLKNMFEIDQKKRPGARELLRHQWLCQ